MSIAREVVSLEMHALLVMIDSHVLLAGIVRSPAMAPLLLRYCSNSWHARSSGPRDQWGIPEDKMHQLANSQIGAPAT